MSTPRTTSRLGRGLGFDRFSGVYLLGLFIVVFSVWEPKLFPTTSTLHSVTAGKAVSAILALAILVPLVAGVYDLSVGASINLTTIIVVKLVKAGWGIPQAMILAVLVGTAIGVVNGFIVVRLKVNSFITTLGMGSIIAAVQVIVTDNQQPLPPNLPRWNNITQTTVGGFQIIVLYMLVIAVIVWWGLACTPAGRYLYAIGSSPDAARLSGVRVDRYTWLSLVVSGTLAGVAGVFYGSLSGPSLSFGGALLLPAFAAVFLGSTQITPGRFNVWGSVLSIYVLATGVRGLALVTNVQWLDPMFSGVALITAVAVALARQRSSEERKRREASAANRTATPGARPLGVEADDPTSTPRPAEVHA